MKLKEDLVKRLREGDCTVEYDGESLDQLNELINKLSLNSNSCGDSRYYFKHKKRNDYDFSDDKEHTRSEIIPLADFFESDMGELEGFPEEIINAMLDEQERQGNKRDIEVFKKNRRAHKDDDGFGWRGSIEGYAFWRSVIYYKNFKTYFDKYPKEETFKNKPKTAEERDKLVKELQAMTFEPTLEEAIDVLEYHSSIYHKNVSQAIGVVVKHLKNVKK